MKAISMTITGLLILCQWAARELLPNRFALPFLWNTIAGKVFRS